MSVIIFSPTGKVAQIRQDKKGKLLTLKSKRVGFIFNQHASAGAFWKGLEQEVQRQFDPGSLTRVYKENTWAPAPKAKVEALSHESDYVLVGVGA